MAQFNIGHPLPVFRFRQAATNHIDLIVQSEVIHRATPLITQHPKPVGIIQYGETIMLFSDAGDFG